MIESDIKKMEKPQDTFKQIFIRYMPVRKQKTKEILLALRAELFFFA